LTKLLRALGGLGRAQRGPKKGLQDPEERKKNKENQKEKKKDSDTEIYVHDEWIC
jgi:Sec-independent protein translocase protein TatA